MQAIDLVGVAFGRGAREQGCADGPEVLRGGGLVDRLRARGVPATWRTTLREEPQAVDPVEAVAGICRPLSLLVESIVAEQSRLAVVGGDHSIAIGTWSGAARAVNDRGPLGLIWVDAHLDSHVPETTPSGAIHGMPLAALFGYGDPRLAHLTRAAPALDPWHVAMIGARSYEPGELALLQRLGVRIFFIEEVRERGLSAVFDEALALTRKGTAGVGLSVDCDSVDPDEAPGVGSPAPGGLARADFLTRLGELCGVAGFVATEIVEFNPHLDQDGRTARLVEDVLVAIACPAP